MTSSLAQDTRKPRPSTMRQLVKGVIIPSAFVGALALFMGLVPGVRSAHAQDKPLPAAAAAGDEAPKVRVERGKGGKKVYRIEEEIRIEGKIQKPEAFYVLQKSSINYDWQDLKQDFLPKILDSVSRAPF
ncbi:MAG: hypothetical protein KA712_12315 [Myxococcales bacterium]|nr:hypothetical protein [Myxococcales bacterium]